MSNSTATVFGLDIGDRYTHIHGLDAAGNAVVVDRMATTPEAVASIFAQQPKGRRFIIETGTHSPWFGRLLEDMGHEVLVADSRRLKMIYENKKKTDKNDARLLAEYGLKAPELLHPTKPRPMDELLGQALLRVRDGLVKARTRLILIVRQLVKSLFGGRIKSCDADHFHSHCAYLPDLFKPIVNPLVNVIATLTKAINKCDKRVTKVCETQFPETKQLMQVHGIGPTTALAFRTTIVSPERFDDPRKVPVYLGLAPGCDNSGKVNKQLGITKAGDATTRRLLVQAGYTATFRGPDSDLQRFGKRLADRGGRGAKKKAANAVARKMAVLLFVLWRDGTAWIPLKNSMAAEAAVPPDQDQAAGLLPAPAC